MIRECQEMVRSGEAKARGVRCMLGDRVIVVNAFDARQLPRILRQAAITAVPARE